MQLSVAGRSRSAMFVLHLSRLGCLPARDVAFVVVYGVHFRSLPSLMCGCSPDRRSSMPLDEFVPHHKNVGPSDGRNLADNSGPITMNRAECRRVSRKTIVARTTNESSQTLFIDEVRIGHDVVDDRQPVHEHRNGRVSHPLVIILLDGLLRFDLDRKRASLGRVGYLECVLTKSFSARTGPAQFPRVGAEPSSAGSCRQPGFVA